MLGLQGGNIEYVLLFPVSSYGVNILSHQFHEFYRDDILRGNAPLRVQLALLSSFCDIFIYFPMLKLI